MKSTQKSSQVLRFCSEIHPSDTSSLKYLLANSRIPTSTSVSGETPQLRQVGEKKARAVAN